jgi:hypothetical protein
MKAILRFCVFVLTLTVNSLWASPFLQGPCEEVFSLNFEGAKPSPKLHTDYLKTIFPSIKIKIVAQDERLRTVEILQDSSNKDNLLTLAISAPNPQMPADLELIYQVLKEGKESMGAAFKARGYQVFKRPVLQQSWPVKAQIQGRMPGKGEAQLQIYEFWVKKEGERPHFYSLVGELDAPVVWQKISKDEDLGLSNPPNFPALLESLIKEFQKRSSTKPL